MRTEGEQTVEEKNRVPELVRVDIHDFLVAASLESMQSVFSPYSWSPAAGGAAGLSSSLLLKRFNSSVSSRKLLRCDWHAVIGRL